MDKGVSYRYSCYRAIGITKRELPRREAAPQSPAIPLAPLEGGSSLCVLTCFRDYERGLMGRIGLRLFGKD